MNKYKIEISGYGAELTIGTVNENEKSVIDNKLRSGLELENIIEYDIIGRDWYDFDDVFHCYSASGNFRITIYENNEEILKIDAEDLYDYEIVNYNCTEINNSEDMILCVNHEKGLFFESEFESESFDVSKLRIDMEEEVGIDNCYFYGDMIRNIWYNEEELHDLGGSTDGKSFEIYKNF